MKKKLPKGQGLEVIAKLEAVGLDRTLAQSIITATDNSLAKKMVEVIKPKASETDKEVNRVDLTQRFDKINQFKFVIPNDYSLKSFRKKFNNAFKVFDSNITDENFKLRESLTVGQTKLVTIYRLNQKSTGKDCLTFIKQKGQQLPNAPALAAIWEQNPESFSRKLWYIGLDNEEFLFKKNLTPMMPVIGHISGAPCFRLMAFTDTLLPGVCIVVMN